MQKIPPITRYLIIANVAVFFIYQLFEPVEKFLIDEGALYPVFYNNYGSLHFNLDFKLWQLVTYMFLHADFPHIFFNMFSLWMFGRIIEQTLGTKRFLAYYFICGIGAGLCQIIMQIFTANLPNAATIGASGACYGILLAFGLLYPNQKIYLIIPPIPIKAKWFVIGYAILEAYLAFNTDSNIAHFAHLGGMLFGLLCLYNWRLWPLSKYGFDRWDRMYVEEKKLNMFQRLWRDFKGLFHFRRRPKMKVYKPSQDSRSANQSEQDAAANSPTPPRSPEEQARIDAVLEKVRRSGYASLTADEKRILFKQK
ncbi:MAG: rhomboid family intramembrane serine protease [Bacteroidales bacterium]|nr:rhomboid family intramembrane serine protease [Bacteroidales bacterium]MDY2704990.1 rhomboid family intramembrane serine protease [Alloprevotella sp.]